MKYPGVPVPRVLEVEVVCSQAAYEGVAAGDAETVHSADVPGLRKWERARRQGFRGDAPFEELGRKELRGGISERDISRVAGVAGITMDFKQPKWNCAPKGAFGKTQLQKIRDRELREGVSGGSVVCGEQGRGSRIEQTEQSGAVCV